MFYTKPTSLYSLYKKVKQLEREEEEEAKLAELFSCDDISTLCGDSNHSSPSGSLCIEHEVMPLPRGMMPLESGKSSEGTTFKVMSYNLLADKFLPSRVPHLKPKANCLSTDFRAQKFISELRESNSDIVCLQEVSTRTIGSAIERELVALGYAIVPNYYYQQKSDLAQLSRRALVNHHRFWSVMTAYKRDKFRLVDSEEINYFYVSYYKYSKSASVTRKQNKGACFLLQSLECPQDLVAVVNTQLHQGKHDPAYVRNAQALYTIERLCHFLEKVKKNTSTDVPFIIASDLNTDAIGKPSK